jgi:CheY-like chemotaxis protein
MARILVIEDDELVRSTIKRILEPAGHAVSTAVDGDDGIRQFRAEPADLVLCDIFMPNKTGIATLKEKPAPMSR